MCIRDSRKIGTGPRAEVVKDRRIYDSDGPGAAHRQPLTWREAHLVLRDLEQMRAGAHAMVGSVSPADGKAPHLSRGQARQLAKQLNVPAKAITAAFAPILGAFGGQPSRRPASDRGICYQARDHGTCDNPECIYDHDPQRLAEARRAKGGGGGRQRSQSRGPQGPKQQGQGDGKGKKGDGKGKKGDGKSKKGWRVRRRRCLVAGRLAAGCLGSGQSWWRPFADSA